MKIPRPEKSEKNGANIAEQSARVVERPAETWEGLSVLMGRLLGPDGCPWDRSQTLESLIPYLIEETYEVVESLDSPANHCQELGDLLFQIVFQSTLRERRGEFSLDDVIAGIVRKMIRRHPDVFGDDNDFKSMKPGKGESNTTGGFDDASATQKGEDVQEQIEASNRQWERLKAKENSKHEGPPRPFEGIPKALPAVQRAKRVQEKAAAFGFDWPDLGGVVAKIEEEWQELKDALKTADSKEIAEEFGDLLFILIRFAQKLQIDPELAINATNRKFEQRFSHVLNRCFERHQDPHSVGLAQMDSYWEEAKITNKP